MATQSRCLLAALITYDNRGTIKEPGSGGGGVHRGLRILKGVAKADLPGVPMSWHRVCHSGPSVQV